MPNNEYLDFQAVRLLLGYSDKPTKGKERVDFISRLEEFLVRNNIDYHWIDGKIDKRQKYENREILVNQSQLREFLNVHFLSHEVMETYKLDGSKLRYIEKRTALQRILFSKFLWFYKKEDINSVFSSPNEKKQYMSLQEVVSFMGEEINVSNINLFRRIMREKKIESVQSGKTSYFLKESVEPLLKEAGEIRAKYCDYHEILSILGYSKVPPSFTVYPADSFIRWALNIKSGASQNVYLQQDALAFKEQKEREEAIRSVEGETPEGTFQDLITLKGITFSDKSVYTTREWFAYCLLKLKTSSASKNTLKRRIILFVNATEMIADFTVDKELYAFSSAEINLRFFNDTVGKVMQTEIYQFICGYHAKLVHELTRLDVVSKKPFDLKKVNNPYKHKATSPRVKKSYSYKEFLNLYDYVKQDFHKRKALDDADKIISGEKDILHYASTWLYVIMHIGNAWRHSDIIELPIIDLKGLNITSLSDLKERDLTTKEANVIVNRFKRNTYIVSKTKAINKFNCPDELSVPFATAITICTLIKEENRFVLHDSNGEQLIPRAIDFHRVNRDKLSTIAQRAFFESFELKGFQFETLKMNRTLLSVLHAILSKNGKGGTALELAKRVRAHESAETTNIYIQLSDDELERLSVSLFARKPFGFIMDLMADVLLGESENREQRTKEIEMIHQAFGNVHKIEATTGFMNKTVTEQRKVADMIHEMGIDEVSSLLFDLNAGTLPSREENYQCIVSPDCKRPNSTCQECPFSVPNFYALSSLAEGLKTTLEEFFMDFDKDSFEGEKTRLMNMIYKDMDHLRRAIQKFGREEVFQFFNGGKSGFDELMEILDAVQTRTGEEILSYLTYQPKHFQLN